MKLTFRWYGDSDPVTLEKIRQIPTTSCIVSAVYDVAPREVWSRESILELKKRQMMPDSNLRLLKVFPFPRI